MRAQLDHRPAAAGARGQGPAPRPGVLAVRLPVGVVLVVGEIDVEVGRHRGIGVDEGEDGVVLAEGGDGVADGGDVAAAGAGEGVVERRGEHPGEALLAESMAALEEQRHPVLLVVPRLAHGATRHFHLSLSL